MFTKIFSFRFVRLEKQIKNQTEVHMNRIWDSLFFYLRDGMKIPILIFIKWVESALKYQPASKVLADCIVMMPCEWKYSIVVTMPMKNIEHHSSAVETQ